MDRDGGRNANAAVCAIVWQIIAVAYIITEEDDDVKPICHL